MKAGTWLARFPFTTGGVLAVPLACGTSFQGDARLQLSLGRRLIQFSIYTGYLDILAGSLPDAQWNIDTQFWPITPLPEDDEMPAAEPNHPAGIGWFPVFVGNYSPSLLIPLWNFLPVFLAADLWRNRRKLADR